MEEQPVNTVSTGGTFFAGRLKNFLPEWRKITQDRFILDLVQGFKIDFLQPPIKQFPVKASFSRDEKRQINEEILKLLHMGVIEDIEHEEGEVISPIFSRPKSDGTVRLILNLKKLNQSVCYEHFKMEGVETVLSMIKQDCFMASVDLKHAYYSLPVDEMYKKYLKFEWEGKLYAFKVLPNGFSAGPRYFTKLLKPVFAKLRAQGHLSVGYIDDIYLQGASRHECENNVLATKSLLEKLGFVIHMTKSELVPSKKLIFLGFVWDSETMTVKVAEHRAQKVKQNCQRILSAKKWSIRELAQVIGQIVACFPGVLWGPLYYRKLEENKILALRKAKGNYDAYMTTLSSEARKELEWWNNNILKASKPIKHEEPDIVIDTDASFLGYGGSCGDIKVSSKWKDEEKNSHINVLELRAVQLVLKSVNKQFCIEGKHVRVRCDNSCAVAYLNNMGGSKSMSCNDVAHSIWEWCIGKNIWLSVSFIPGKSNIEADYHSRVFNDDTEWQLSPKVFRDLCSWFDKPEVDLFATRLNYQIKPFVSWKPDPECWAIDAFSVNWNRFELIYGFPPFSIIHRVLSKWETEEAEGVIIAPLWQTAAWFPQLLRLLTDFPVILPKTPRLLQLPGADVLHPLRHKLQMVACRLSGNVCKSREFREKLKTLSWHPGDRLQRNSISLTYIGGSSFVCNGEVIPSLQM